MIQNKIAKGYYGLGFRSIELYDTPNLKQNGQCGPISNAEVTRCTIEDSSGLKGIIQGCKSDAVDYEVQIFIVMLAGAVTTTPAFLLCIEYFKYYRSEAVRTTGNVGVWYLYPGKRAAGISSFNFLLNVSPCPGTEAFRPIFGTVGVKDLSDFKLVTNMGKVRFRIAIFRDNVFKALFVNYGDG